MLNETLFRFSEAPSHIPGRPSLATIHRWRLRGVRGVRLETVKVGGKRFTSLEAIRRFVEATNRGADTTSKAVAANRQRAIERAERELAENGI